MSKEMTAVEYLKAKKRMCVSMKGCDYCQLRINDVSNSVDCFERGFEEEAVSIVQKWAEEHPINTRQSEFLKIYPNAKMQDGAIRMCPLDLDVNFNCRATSERISCNTCRKEYWLKEVK